MVICLELGADLHIMVQLMPLPLTVSCFSGFTFWYWLTQVVPDKGPLNGCVCVCVLLKGGEGKRRGGREFVLCPRKQKKSAPVV